METRVLVVEDETDFAELVVQALRREGFQAVAVGTGQAALSEVRHRQPDIVLLDVMLPDLPGTEVCRRLQSDPKTRGIPIIMITALGGEVDRILGFELGADDYLVKPVSLREIPLRIRAVLRRGEVRVDPCEFFECGSLRVDSAGHRAFIGGVMVPLTPLEFRLLAFLGSRQGRVLDRETILSAVWGLEAEVEPRSVDALVKRLRSKLGDAGRHVETVRGVGYRFSPDMDSPWPGESGPR